MVDEGGTRVSAKEISARALNDLGLPPLDDVTPVIAQAYGYLAEAIVRLKKRKALSNYQRQQLPEAIVTLCASWTSIPAPGSDADLLADSADVVTAEAWLAWLYAQPAVAPHVGLPATVDQASLLRYLGQVERQASFADLAALDFPQECKVSLADVRGGRLVGALPERARRPVVLLSIPYGGHRREGNPRRSVLACLEFTVADATAGVPDPPLVLFDHAVFFDDNDLPRFDFDLDAWTVLQGDWPPEAATGWTTFFAVFEGRWQATFGGPIEEIAQRQGRAALGVEAHVFDMETIKLTGVGELYAEIARSGRIPPLLAQALSPRSPATMDLPSAPREALVGHMDTLAPDGRRTGLPLDATQRLAAMAAASLGTDTSPSVLPVNGPPGTGKTSFLRAVLASWWVEAAAQGRAHPPVVIATGATNKAITNVIEAFGAIAEPGIGGSLLQRWLPGLPSYGWLVPSQMAQKQFPYLMHLLGTRGALSPGGGATILSGTPAATPQGLVAGFLAGARGAFPDAVLNTLEDAVAHLQRKVVAGVEALRFEQSTMREALTRLVGLARASDRLRPAARRQATVRLVQLDGQLAQQETAWPRLDQMARTLERWVSTDPRSKTGLLRSIPVLGGWFARQDAAKHQAAGDVLRRELAALGRPMPASVVEASARIEAAYAEAVAAGSALEASKKEAGTLREVLGARVRLLDQVRATRGVLPQEFRDGKGARLLWRAAKGRSESLDAFWQAFDAGQDRAWRFRLFHLAARYWEGRWLQDYVARSTPGAETPAENELQRWSMLGVVIVSTLAKLPAVLKIGTPDILVMDETGQCPASAAMAFLSKARHALLVGDTEQLQPISAISEAQSRAIAARSGLAWNALPPALCAARGSMMKAAQRACSFTDGGRVPGISLLYHYRCHPWIIGYCNMLLYGGAIHAMRPASGRGPLPPMSWVDVRSAPARVGSSWRNDGEALEIANWLRRALPVLKQAYPGKSSREIVAVITPLGAQAGALRTTLSNALGQEAEGMIIGTVHALQGAECPVVAFSLVQDPTSGSLFADRDGGHLMNVAVSRAKDSFVLFGDRRALTTSGSDKRPVAQLGRWMAENGERLYPRTVVVIEAPGKAKAIQAVLGPEVRIIPTKGTLARLDRVATDGGLTWAPLANFDPWAAEMGEFDDLRELVVATDDDLAGEMIGWHAARWVSDRFVRSKRTVPTISRLRFHSLEPSELQASFAARGARFDGALLRAALVRSATQALDQEAFAEALPGTHYLNPHARAVLATVRDLQALPSWEVQVACRPVEGGDAVATFLAGTPASLAPPARYPTAEAAREAASTAGLRTGLTFTFKALPTVRQRPSLYPASTTLRILSAAAAELLLAPWETQEELNALYQEGAR